MKIFIFILFKLRYKYFSCCQRKPEVWANEAEKKICCDFGKGMHLKWHAVLIYLCVWTNILQGAEIDDLLN